jgi:hypothetical protein
VLVLTLLALKSEMAEGEAALQPIADWIENGGEEEVQLCHMTATSVAEAVCKICQRAIERKVEAGDIDWRDDDARKHLARELFHESFDVWTVRLQRERNRLQNDEFGRPRNGGYSQAPIRELCARVGLNWRDYEKLPRIRKRLISYLLRHPDRPSSVEDLAADVWAVENWNRKMIIQGVYQLKRDLTSDRLSRKYQALSDAIQRNDEGYFIDDFEEPDQD